ncbi:MAG TPA: DUF3761 domain-containing protein [Caulobacterales bacterium]|nr:DUF3761 domain-containing protein [Caulobacterales bacterium]
MLLVVGAFWVIGKCSETPTPTPTSTYSASSAPISTTTFQPPPYASTPSSAPTPPTAISDEEFNERYRSEDETGSDTGYYTNSDGLTVRSPEYSTDGSVPSGATAQCRDGSYSFSFHHQGTCSHHGGVGRWLD